MSTPSHAATPDPVSQLFQIATGYMLAAALYSAAKLGIADLLAEGPRPVEKLAQTSGANADALNRTLRALASIGVFRETAPKTFENTAASASLRTRVSGSVRDAVLWIASPMHFRVYADFLHPVTSGETAIEHVTGCKAFEFFEKDAEEGSAFNNGMSNFSGFFSPPVLEAYDFSDLGTVADIGGGRGFFLTDILRNHPDLRGILFEMPYLYRAARVSVESSGVGQRCEVVAGDFFKEVPPADNYIMKSVIHDWDDESAVAILKNCARAMRGKGKVILVELLVGPANQPGMAKWVDLEMLALAGGRERSESEYRELFARAGLSLSRVVPTTCPYCVIEAQRL